MSDPSSIVDRLLAIQQTVLHDEETALTPDEYVVFMDKQKDALLLPDWKIDGTEWFNVQRPLTVDDVRGNIVVVDFFTYCCINCIHTFPFLSRIERYREVLVVGVHSAKFNNERIAANVAASILKYNLHHPVLNDPRGVLWDRFGVHCWPTFVLVGPGNRLLYAGVGEGSLDFLEQLISEAVTYYTKERRIELHDLPLMPMICHSNLEGQLRFPGKLSLSPSGDSLAISDSGHHRILIVDAANGVVQRTIGDKFAHHQDGDSSSARFSSPQGVCWVSEDILYVADTNNHCVRKIVLSANQVSTVVKMDESHPGFKSPWDVCVGNLRSGEDGNVLFIAVAGSHQIWALALSDTHFWDGSDLPQGTCRCIAGSGKEENRNNAYASRASFAQPSGLCVGTHTSVADVPFLYVADSESSTIRKIALSEGTVKNVVGGGLDPLDLFSFGDEDGIGTKAKLQHPMGVAYHDGKLYVADTYNNKVKCVNLSAGSISSLSVPGLSEPNGVCVSKDGNSLYVADTNNHRIQILTKETSIRTLPIIFPTTVQVRDAQLSIVEVDGKRDTADSLLLLPGLSVGQTAHIDFHLKLPEDCTINDLGKSEWTLDIPDSSLFLSSIKGTLTSDKLSDVIRVTRVAAIDCDITFVCHVVYCSKGRNTCHVAHSRTRLKFPDKKGEGFVADITFDVTSKNFALNFIHELPI